MLPFFQFIPLIISRHYSLNYSQEFSAWWFFSQDYINYAHCSFSSISNYSNLCFSFWLFPFIISHFIWTIPNYHSYPSYSPYSNYSIWRDIDPNYPLCLDSGVDCGLGWLESTAAPGEFARLTLDGLRSDWEGPTNPGLLVGLYSLSFKLLHRSS